LQITDLVSSSADFIQSVNLKTLSDIDLLWCGSKIVAQYQKETVVIILQDVHSCYTETLLAGEGLASCSIAH